MANFCPKPIGGIMMEIINEDACGLTVTGANAGYRSAGFVNITLSPDVETAADIVEYNAAGDACVQEKGSPVLKGFNAKMTMCGVNPILLNMLLPNTTPILATTDVIGLSLKGGVRNTKNFHLKIWSAVPSCGGGTLKYVAYGFSRCQNPVLSGDIVWAKDTVQHAVVDFYVHPGNPAFTDPTTVFTAGELADHLMTFKGVATIPGTSNECGYLAIP